MNDATLRAQVAAALRDGWTPFGYTTPHRTTYPHQWLWDSCFHSLVWAELGEEVRAADELASVFRHQSASGFVPHMAYDATPDLHARFWGRAGTSSITQPPVYGHTIAEHARRGIHVPGRVLHAATHGFAFLLRRRRRVDGLVSLVHPWESGGDDSPRWDDWFAPVWHADTWFRRKGELVRAIAYDDDGSPVGNDAFVVASAGFNALVAFGALELASVTDDDRLRAEADELVGALDARWSSRLETWTDGDRPSGAVRTAYDLLGHLVVDRPLPSSLFEPDGYGTPFGPAGVHVAEPAFVADAYWRGSVWPQVLYLLVVAAARRGQPEVAEALRGALRRGVVTSELAEHWDARTGDGLGARPQGWAGLTIVAPPSAS